MILYSSGDAIKAAQEVAEPKHSPQEVLYRLRTEFLKMRFQEENEVLYIFCLSCICLFNFISAQYESFILPLPIILSLPTGILVLLSLSLLGLGK